MSSNERPFEYLSKLFQVCSEAQNPSAMSEANFRAQKFFSDLEIIRRTAEPNSYFRVIPTEGYGDTGCGVFKGDIQIESF